MYFSSLKASSENSQQTRIENKQRINLSSHAYSTLLHDMDIFRPESAKQGEVCSELINHIFANFHNRAESSIAEKRQDERLRLLELLSGMQDPVAREVAITLLLKAYTDDLEQRIKRRCTQKDHSLTFRISKKNLDYLLSADGQREAPAYCDNIGTYFKALLEEYCEHPYVERERIYCRQYIDEIGLAIRNTEQLRIVTRGTHISYVKPLEIGQDPERLYNYLVGLIATNREGPWQIGSIRLSSMSSCDRQSHSAFISSEKAKEIRSAIKETGIQYLAGNNTFQRIVVEFTPEGEKLYRSMLHLRPQYTRKTGRRYEFCCSIRQADNYFFKFGHNARLLEPESLAIKFRNMYEHAAKKYW